MPTYLNPGNYGEEVSLASKPIEGVGTAVAAFVGMAPKGPVNQPVMITNWAQYVQTFGDNTSGAFLGHAVYGFFLNGGGTCYVIRVGARGARNADARIGDLTVRALKPGPAGNEISVEVSYPPEGSAESMVRIVVRQGDDTEQHEALLLSGMGVVVQTLNLSQLVRVELDQSSGQLESLPQGSVMLSGGELVDVDVAQSHVSPDDYVGDPVDRSGFGGLETIREVRMVAVPTPWPRASGERSTTRV